MVDVTAAIKIKSESSRQWEEVADGEKDQEGGKS